MEEETMAATQKVALITGAGTGIGKAVALALMKEGYAAVLAGRRKDKLEETATEGKSTGDKILVAPTDVSEPADIKALFAKTKETFGRLDLLFNNAGIGAPPVPLEDLPYETWKKVVDTNLTGMFLCTQEAIRIMKAQEPRGGRIINNGSISAHAPRPRSAPYTATKHAVTGLTKSTSLDCRAYNITCSQIDIGNAATPLTERMGQGQGVMQADGRMAMEPRMNADDVGRAVVYIANLPLDTNVLFLTVMANLMPFVGRG
jgi:NAD(P)-dependent dehydrogenase (short-subunit alcohol dehydrogenase family)